MSIQPYILSEVIMNTSRGSNNIDLLTGSAYVTPILYNEEVPTGSAVRAYVKGGTSVSVIDPNGEGVCKPRLVASASFKVSIINSASAVPGGTSFDNCVATVADITDLATFLGNRLSSEPTIPAVGL